MEEQFISFLLPCEIGHYVFHELIGEGSFSQVFLGVHSLTGIPVSIKMIPLDNEIFHEVELLKQLDFPYVSQYYDSFSDDSYLYLVMEHIPNGNLTDQINTQGRFNETQAQLYFSQIISAMTYLHKEAHIIHRDLKCDNIMLDRNDQIRLIDFGLSRKITRNQKEQPCGTPYYMSPEVITEGKFSEKSDIWSLGVILYSMVCGYLPFDKPTLDLLFEQISDPDEEVNFPLDLTSDLIDLLSRMLDKNHERRITLEEIRAHPWFNLEEYNLIFDENGKIDPQYKTLSFGVKSELDFDVVMEMEKVGLSAVGLSEKFKNNIHDHETAAYRLYRRKKILCLMGDTCYCGNFRNRITDRKSRSGKSLAFLHIGSLRRRPPKSKRKEELEINSVKAGRFSIFAPLPGTSKGPSVLAQSLKNNFDF